MSTQKPLDLQNSKPGTNRPQIMTNKMANKKSSISKAWCQAGSKCPIGPDPLGHKFAQIEH